MKFLCFVVLLCLQGHSRAAQIIFQATPPVLSPTTQTLNLRCTVTDDALGADMSHVTSIVISRDNQTIGSVTIFDPAMAEADLSNIQVQGTVNSGTSGELGYLDLTWTNPSSTQTGSYTCEVFGLNAAQHPESLTDMVSITASNLPTVDELLQHIMDLENRTSALEQQIQNVGGSNVQNGFVQCAQGTNDFSVTFPSPYTSVPKVFTAYAGSGSNTAYAFPPQILNLNTAGFTMRCTSNEVNTMLWVAIG